MEKKCDCKNVWVLVPTGKFSVLEIVRSICSECSGEGSMDLDSDDEMSITDSEDDDEDEDL